MPRIFIRGRRISIHQHHHPRRREVFKTEASTSQIGLKYRRVCPNCGHPEFKTIPSRLSWLFGQKSKCNKCGFIFKKSWTEKEYQKKRKFERSRR